MKFDSYFTEFRRTEILLLLFAWVYDMSCDDFSPNVLKWKGITNYKRSEEDTVNFN